MWQCHQNVHLSYQRLTKFNTVPYKINLWNARAFDKWILLWLGVIWLFTIGLMMHNWLLFIKVMKWQEEKLSWRVWFQNITPMYHIIFLGLLVMVTLQLLQILSYYYWEWLQDKWRASWETDLKVFVVVKESLPKEGWARVAVPILLLVWQRLFKNIIYDVSRVKFWKVGVIPKEGWARPRPPILLLVWHWQRP